MLQQKHLRTLSRRFWGTLFTLVIAVAVLVQLGRQAFPLLEDYHEDISRYLGQKIGMEIEIGSIDATWSGLRPKLDLIDVHLKSTRGESVFTISEVTAELGLVNSLTSGRLFWRHLKFDGFSTTLIQSEGGTWAIKGLSDFIQTSKTQPDSQKGKLAIDDPYDIFLFGRRVSISQATFNIQYFSGGKSQLVVPNISLENDLDFHRMLANIVLDEGEQIFSLIVEGHGDPRDENFVASGYLELNKFPTQKVADALALSPVRVDEIGHELSLKLWFHGNSIIGTTMVGEFQADGRLTVVGKDINLPRSVSARLTGNMQRDSGWQLAFEDLQTSWEGMRSPALNMEAYGDFRRLNGIRVQELDLGKWTEALLHAGLGNAAVEKTIRTINPRGKAKNVDVVMVTPEKGHFQATALIEKGMSDAFKGAPAITNANGYLSMNLAGGYFDVAVNDGLSLALPKVYHQALFFSQAEGRIQWQVDFENKHTYVTSGLIKVTNPEEQGFGYLNLSLPFKKKYGEQKMTLAIGVEETAALNHRKYVPKTVPKTLYDWLDASVKGGRVSNVRFLYHGSVEKGAAIPPTIQLRGDIYEADLAFDPQWPELKNARARLILDNQQMEIHIDEGTLLDNKVVNTSVRLVKNQVGKGQALSIKSNLHSDADTAINLLKIKPIKNNIGSAFDTWQVSGRVRARANLVIPLGEGSPGLSQKIDVTLANTNLEIPELKLAIDKINGQLHYQTGKGVYADKLSASLWQHPFVSSIESSEESEGNFNTRVNFSGSAHIDDLYAWTKQASLKFLQGSTTISGSVFVPGNIDEQPVEVTVSSRLEGVEVNLPEPFVKNQDESLDFKGRVRLYDIGEEYRFTFGEHLSLAFLNAKDAPTSVKIEINNETKQEGNFHPIDNTGRFDVSGRLDQFQLDQWNQVKDQYLLFLDQSDNADNFADELEVQFDLFIDEFIVSNFEMEKLHVRGERQRSNWVLDVKSEALAGKVVLSEAEKPIVLNLEYLNLNPPEAADGSLRPNSEMERSSVLAGIDLHQIPAIDFSTRELLLTGSSYGSWDFKIRPVDGGMIVHDIRALVKGMSIGSEEKGAEFVWLKNEEVQSSQFTGTLSANNLGDVFEAWEKEKLLESESAVITIDAQWPGAPDQITLEAVKGLVGLDIRRGSFNRGAGSDENGLLRLLALFNIDTILRRLRLDFADLASQGYSYDKIYGNLDFKGGTIFMTEPLIIESSSSYAQMAGTVDLVGEKVDGEMVVTLPVASNVALATAMVVGLPAALGVYVMSKLFKKQVDKASSLNIEVVGRWEEPKIKVKKIFDIDAANRRGKEIKEENASEILNTSQAPAPD